MDASSTPHVIFLDSTQSSKGAVFSYSGGGWERVGEGAVSGGRASRPALAFSPATGALHIAYSDAAAGSRAHVKTFEGGAWGLLGAAGFSAGQATLFALAFDSAGGAYLAYRCGRGRAARCAPAACGEAHGEPHGRAGVGGRSPAAAWTGCCVPLLRAARLMAAGARARAPAPAPAPACVPTCTPAPTHPLPAPAGTWQGRTRPP